ncbi:DUF1766-domain-containing protein [Lindgomyces ingoldianus]|uniref:DUF1766-domain-containing protein n=1 Tax=Lindgomyces ingoldianus TaxID=673940 RepID=A0ACB6QN06_9PLEO|nr:DUF1766-domain-containing protein [Lindgomyces ingoldianus]KAF2468404.1 DUF1766-domain-containing protein [Lindgomyces ingoldianus]
MTLSKETQEEITNRVNGHSKANNTNTATPYPSPPNSPPQSEPSCSKSRGETEDKRRPSGTTTSLPVTPPTSLNQHPPKSTLKDQKPVENRKRLDASALKRDLGLRAGKCGGLTRADAPCKSSVRSRNKDQIDSQIDSMTTLTQSSPELDTELDKLVMLVHCHWHNCNNPKWTRIKDWKAKFPIGDGKPVESVEKRIKRALGQVSAKCAGTTAQREPCQRRIGGQKVQNCTKTIDEILQPEVYLDDTYLEALLKVLQANMYCHLHVGNRPPEKVASWKSDILEIRKQADVELVQSIESDTTEGVESQTRDPISKDPRSLSTKTSNDPTSRNRSFQTRGNSRSLSSDFTRDPATFWPAAYDTTPFEIVSRIDKLADYKSSYKLVQNIMKRPLDDVDQKDGYVYMYEVEGNKGFVKIGYTGRSIEIRHEEWTFDCNRKTKPLYPIKPNSVMLVPHARRIEALCHAELNHHNIEMYCRGCLKNHLEWFKISPEEAISVIEKWTKWMKTRPYQPTQLRSGEKWSLTETERHRSLNIDQFMKEISVYEGNFTSH